MTILSHNQPWPQAYFRHWDYVLNGYAEGYEDESIINMIATAQNVRRHWSYESTKILFAGPRAARKIKDLAARDGYLGVETQDFSSAALKKEFLGLELILTVDDGLWIA